jgi:acylphosphatase
MANFQITITGKVYKVGFMYYVKQIALRNDIQGVARYTDNLSVLIKAQGKNSSMDKFMNYCRLGCVGSEIEGFEIKEIAPGHYQFFEIIE